jgi:hypothetical protein
LAKINAASTITLTAYTNFLSGFSKSSGPSAVTSLSQSVTFLAPVLSTFVVIRSKLKINYF